MRKRHKAADSGWVGVNASVILYVLRKGINLKYCYGNYGENVLENIYCALKCKEYS